MYERLDRIEGLLVIVKDNRAPESEDEEEHLLNVWEAARYLGDAAVQIKAHTAFGYFLLTESDFHRVGLKKLVD